MGRQHRWLYRAILQVKTATFGLYPTTTYPFYVVLDKSQVVFSNILSLFSKFKAEARKWYMVHHTARNEAF
jgi:hypothetical protein